VWVGYAASASVASGLAAALSAIAGALVGATAVFAITHAVIHGDVVSWMLHVPAVGPWMFDVVAARVDRDGVESLLAAPFQGIPYKVYTAVLTLRGTSLPLLLFWTIPSRALRLVPVAVVGSLARYPLGAWISRHPRAWIALYGVAWLAFYLWYWTHLPQ
jgi:hypothetical protein